MKVALGVKAHSGWAALVAIGATGDRLEVVDRRRIELVEHTWAKAPYHAAEKVAPDKARGLVKRGIAEAYRVAEKTLRGAVKNLGEHEIVACAVLTPNPMPAWTTDEILAVHFRMHKAEGVLFPDALASAAKACGLILAAIPERELEARDASGDRARKIRRRAVGQGSEDGGARRDHRLASSMIGFSK